MGGNVMNNLIIRKAEINDLKRIMEIYEIARKFMADNGNKNQWSNKYPSEEIIEKDIEKNQLYVLECMGDIHGVFAFIIGKDKTYNIIENGEWLSDSEYGTIHRVASDGKVHNVLNEVIAYCSKKISHLRIDTHKDNTVMRHLIVKNGFSERGTIYTDNGSERIAFERL